MKGFAAFVRKEAVEIVRTWRIWVLPGILLVFAVTGPLTAKYTPEIIASVGGSQMAAIAKVIPVPTYVDAYAQWIKNLSQIALFAIIIIYGGLVSAESKSGTAVLVLTKPVSRAAFVVAKALVHSTFLALTVLVGTLITWAGTLLLFGTAPAGPLFAAAGAWLVFGVLFVALMTLLSVLVSSQAGAAGIGLGVYALVSISAIWEPVAKYSPAALAGQPMAIAAGQGVDVTWPIVTSLLLSAALVTLAVWAFRRKEL
ncbi:MAG TPA: ABC transporter permease [Coriobacteriia bacterium]